jgi:hypothetical protein
MNRVQQLKEAATVLASHPNEQLKHLEEIGVPGGVDELALEYDAIAAAAKDMQLSGELSPSQYEATRALNQLLSEMSAKDYQDLWTIESLSSASQWQEVRRLASGLLKLLSAG